MLLKRIETILGCICILLLVCNNASPFVNTNNNPGVYQAGSPLNENLSKQKLYTIKKIAFDAAFNPVSVFIKKDFIVSVGHEIRCTNERLADALALHAYTCKNTSCLYEHKFNCGKRAASGIAINYKSIKYPLTKIVVVAGVDILKNGSEQYPLTT